MNKIMDNQSISTLSDSEPISSFTIDERYQMLYEIANKLVDRISKYETHNKLWDQIVHKGIIKSSPFDKLGEFFGHMSNSSNCRPQYMTKQQQKLLKQTAENLPELNGMCVSEKENVMKQKMNEYNNKYGPYNRWPISHLPFWYLINNNCILHGYRNNITFKTVFCNLFWKHNELMDIIIDYIFVIIEIFWFIYLCKYENKFYMLQPLETKLIILTTISRPGTHLKILNN